MIPAPDLPDVPLLRVLAAVRAATDEYHASLRNAASDTETAFLLGAIAALDGLAEGFIDTVLETAE